MNSFDLGGLIPSPASTEPSSRLAHPIPSAAATTRSKDEGIARPPSKKISKPHPLLRFQNVAFRGSGERPVFSRVTFDVHRGDRLFIFGARNSGKSSLVNLITGAVAPSGGKISRHCRISFTLGELPFFAAKASLVDYVRFLATSFGASPDEVWTFFASLAIPAYRPDCTMGSLSAKDRRTLSVIIGLLIPFDIYVLDDYSPALTASADLALIFEERARSNTFVVSTKIAAITKQHATRIGVISGGGVAFFDTFSDGVRAFHAAPGDSAPQ